jgi:hypothetical protein
MPTNEESFWVIVFSIFNNMEIEYRNPWESDESPGLTIDMAEWP